MDRHRLEKTYAGSYKREYPFGDNCGYCGQSADSEDHIPPLAILPMLIAAGEGDRYERRLIPACRDCNVRLGASHAMTLRKRRKVLASRLERKYKHLLRRVVWDEDELSEMGRNMRGYIETSQAKREYVMERLRVLRYFS